jgi:hypothetical protein
MTIAWFAVTANNALQRTRVRPAGGRSPQSSDTLDDLKKQVSS